MSNLVRGVVRGTIALLALLVPLAAHAQNGRITGTVTSALTGEPLGSVQVFVAGTSVGSLSNSAGTFSLENVPAGVHMVIAQRIGFQEARQTEVRVAGGGTTTLSFTMSQAVLALQGIVATGLVDPVEGVRAPIAVARVSREMMPVVSSGGAAVQNLQGRVAGVTINRTSGQPGAGVTMQLRTPTTVRTDGSSSPLIVVDGVILGGSGTISTSDIEAMDIESIEVIRGAAASSLYGSRAASGVIAITTARGNSLPVGETRFTARSEMGISQNVRGVPLAEHHAYLMDPTNTYYVDANGNQVGRNQRVLPLAAEGSSLPLAYAFMDKPYPGGTYDNVSAVTRPGNYRSNNISLSGNAESTNFAVTLSNMHEQGSLVGNDGYRRTSARVNLDHRFARALSSSVSMSHSRDGRENIAGATNPFNAALSGPRDVDFTVRDENGNYIQQPDPNINFQNPLWESATRESDEESSRTLMNAGLTWNPFSWLSTSGSVGYDRSDSWSRTYTPKGTPANVGSSGELDGSIAFNESERSTLNAEGQLTVRRDFGSLNIRSTVRGLLERDEFRSGGRSGSGFTLNGVPQLSSIPLDLQRSTSSEQDVRALGYLWDTAFDYDGKYVFTVLGRRDGSSLFGPENRWHNYYRVAGAWRIGEESWFNIPNVDELKLSVARGTAGGRPGFAAQYDVWTVSGGLPTKSSLGNPELAPEHTTENEFSLSTILFGKYSLVVTHARQTTVDQLVQAALPAYTGYPSQWVNAGAVAGHTTEIEFEAQLIQDADLGWTTGVVGDYKYAEITDWPIACQTPGWRYNCLGEPVYGLYSWWLVKDQQGLKRHRGGEAWPFADQFQVNDEGFLVWVGDKNFWEGLDADGNVVPDTWGTVSPMIGGRTYKWGVPFPEQNDQGNNLRQLMGKSAPTNIGWTNNVRYKVFNFHAHLQGTVGGVVNNTQHQALTENANQRTGPRLDQFGRPNALKKPVEYYLANVGDATYHVEDGSFIKLRTLSANVTLNQGQLRNLGLGFLGIRNATIGLVGRNIFTITNYRGFDPEAGLDLATRANSNSGGYPPTRSLTTEISVTF